MRAIKSKVSKLTTLSFLSPLSVTSRGSRYRHTVWEPLFRVGADGDRLTQVTEPIRPMRPWRQVDLITVARHIERLIQCRVHSEAHTTAARVRQGQLGAGLELLLVLLVTKVSHSTLVHQRTHLGREAQVRR